MTRPMTSRSERHAAQRGHRSHRAFLEEAILVGRSQMMGAMEKGLREAVQQGAAGQSCGAPPNVLPKEQEREQLTTAAGENVSASVPQTTQSRTRGFRHHPSKLRRRLLLPLSMYDGKSPDPVCDYSARHTTAQQPRPVGDIANAQMPRAGSQTARPWTSTHRPVQPSTTAIHQRWGLQRFTQSANARNAHQQGMEFIKFGFSTGVISSSTKYH